MWHTKSIQAKALLYTILLSAISHLLITFYVALVNGNPDAANMFSILGISLLVPALGHGALNAVLGGLCVCLIWAVIFSVMLWHRKRQAQAGAEKE